VQNANNRKTPALNNLYLTDVNQAVIFDLISLFLNLNQKTNLL